MMLYVTLSVFSEGSGVKVQQATNLVVSSGLFANEIRLLKDVLYDVKMTMLTIRTQNLCIRKHAYYPLHHSASCIYTLCKTIM